MSAALRPEESLSDTDPLPSLTTDHAMARADLDRWGYCLIDKALSADEVTSLRTRLANVAANEAADGVGNLYDRNESQSVSGLLNKGKPFIDMVLHPLAMEFMAHILGPDFILSNTAALIKGPGGPAQVVHADQTFMPEPWAYPVVANVMWMLDDFTEENGATRVLPGSHTRGINPPGWNYMQPKTRDFGFQPETVPVCGPAGTAMIFEGRLWHHGGTNHSSDQRRHGLLTYYAKPFIRQQENFFRSLSPSVVNHMSPELKKLLGYDPYFVLGAVAR